MTRSWALTVQGNICHKIGLFSLGKLVELSAAARKDVLISDSLISQQE